jgi:hypothetical protein
MEPIYPQRKQSWRAFASLLAIVCFGMVFAILLTNHSFLNVAVPVSSARLAGFLESLNTGKSGDNLKMKNLEAEISWRMEHGCPPDEQEKWWYERLLTPNELNVVRQAWSNSGKQTDQIQAPESAH